MRSNTKKRKSAAFKWGVWAICLLYTGLAHAQTKPNIIFILADDMGYYSLGAFGQKLIKTPNLDKLATNGMKFTNFYSNHICSPSRGSLLTGMHTGEGLVRGNYELGGYTDDTEYGQMPLPLNFQTLGSELKKAGYTTAVMGKWGVGGPNSTGAPNLHGIDLFYGYLDQKQAHNYYPTHLWRNDRKEDLPNPSFFSHQPLPKDKDPNNPQSYAPYQGKIYSADTINSEAIKFIRQNKKKPFFLELAYTLPHMALQVPDRVLARYKGKFDDKPYLGDRGYLPNQYPRATYAAMITLLDDYVGTIVKALEENGLAGNTLIVFTADNGAAKVGGCDPDYFKTSGDLRGRKGSIFEGGIKEPFIAYWPGVITPGSSTNHLCAIWDIMPTFLEVSGATVPAGLNGLSFLPTLKQQPSLQKSHEFLYWERHGKNEDHDQAVRFGDWKAIKNVKTSNVVLYNLKTDPSEKTDLSKDHPELIARAVRYFDSRKLAAVVEWNFGKRIELGD